MTLVTARAVLKDCRLAHEMMEMESDADRLRVLWIGGLGLIRLVGSVLKEVDREILSYRNAIDKHWKELVAAKDSGGCQIFWKFIKADRDRALHRYEVDLHESAEIPLLVAGDESAEIVTLDECLFMPLEDDGWRGVESGGDARDAYSEAIEWWQEQIEQIERNG